MAKVELRRPFFVVNPKSYLYGKELIDLAKCADELAIKYDVDILFTAPLIDLKDLIANTKRVIPTAQHMEEIKPGRGMGHICPDALKDAGVKATFLNHAENPMVVSKLAATMKRADELDILTIVCADSVSEAKAIAKLGPDVMVCEPTELIGTGKTSDASYMKATNEAVKSVCPKTKVLQAAGISTAQNVYDAIVIGADGTGGTSGIVCAKDPKETLTQMIEALVKAREEIKGE